MRTGPFSDPTIVTLINRYFVAYHMNNEEWTEPRYGMEPGEENAYLLMETPNVEGVDKEHVLLGRLSQVLDPRNARKHILEFLDAHADVVPPWPELRRLEGKMDRASRLRRAELLLEEGRTAKALEEIEGLDGARAKLFRARARRIDGELDAAASALNEISAEGMTALGRDGELEAIRLAFERGEDDMARILLGRFLGSDPPAGEAAEAMWMRGWLHHRAGEPEKAIAVWTEGIEKYPPQTALFSQKAYFTSIRANWELPDNVDQPY